MAEIEARHHLSSELLPRAEFRPILDGIIYCDRAYSGTNSPKNSGPIPPSSNALFETAFERLWAVLIEACDELDGVHWEWQSADAVLNKARFGGTSSAKTPLIEAKSVKRGLIVEEEGGAGAIVWPMLMTAP